MRRRDALKSMAGLTAAVRTPTALFARPQSQSAPEATDEPAVLPSTLADEVGDPRAGFFTSDEMAVFRRLAEALVPRTRTPGALDAGAPEFLDFYLSQSEPERQALYREGLTRFHKALETNSIDKVLAPLREPWAPVASPDVLVSFLRAAKEDLFRATVNSRAWALATEGRRRSTGATYWYPVE